MKSFLLHTITLVASIALCACGDDNKNSDGPATPAGNSTITASIESISAPVEGLSTTFQVTATGEWDAYSNDSWITLKKNGTASTSGNVDVTVAENTTTETRTGTITLACGRGRTEIEVLQAAKEPEPIDETIEVPEGYELVWHDEFDEGTEPDSRRWRHEVQGQGWVNNELQNYVAGSYNGKRVTEVADGKLTITAFKDGGKVYSGRIYGNERTGWQYGIFEARLKLPKGKGTWPAFWMMPVTVDWANEGWPKCGEIDIMEEVGVNPNYTSSSIHCEAYNHVMNTQKTAERLTSGAESDFHVYRLEWTPDYIRTYVDGKMLLSFDNEKKGVKYWPFDKPFYLILNLAWGGDWGGWNGVDESALPAKYEVDYVRVFQQKK